MEWVAPERSCPGPASIVESSRRVWTRRPSNPDLAFRTRLPCPLRHPKNWPIGFYKADPFYLSLRICSRHFDRSPGIPYILRRYQYNVRRLGVTSWESHSSATCEAILHLVKTGRTQPAPPLSFVGHWLSMLTPRTVSIPISRERYVRSGASLALTLD